jgi:hypothetical protein
MECRHVQEALGSGLGADAAVERHMESCEQCRRFAADLQWIRALCLPSVATPPLLRERTLEQCRAVLAERAIRRRLRVRERCRRFFDSPRFVVVAAVLCILIAVGVGTLQIDDIQDEETNVSINLTIIQFVVQNLLAALALPALWVYRNKLGRSARLARSQEIMS